jgi:UDP-GlcNAc:undecaprenyl-phosphate/decaprenyl-phosphate GlcNAc-1-phosphate transferase
MDNNIFLIPFLVSFFLAAVLLVAIIVFIKGKEIESEDKRSSSRHIHLSKTTRFGGVAIILSFILTLLLNHNLVISPQLFWVFVLSGAILIFGTLDDIWQLSWKQQLVFQILISLLVFLFGFRLEYVTNPFGGIFLFESWTGYFFNLVLVIAWILLIINAMNWVDGIDGVSGGISAIGALAIFFVSLRPEVNQPPVGIISMALLGAILAFVVFNFNPAKIMAGTSGSVFMGFILACLALFAGAKIATTMLVLAIPIIDALWVIFERLGSHSSVFMPDKRHLHYRLLKLGWTQRRICLFYWFLTGLIAVAALGAGAIGKLTIFFVVFLLMLVFYIAILRKKPSYA